MHKQVEEAQSKHIPDGFIPHENSGPIAQPWLPIYEKTEADRVLLGLWTDTQHLNGRDNVHGGFIAAIFDYALGLSCKVHMDYPARMLTTNLNIDYLHAVKKGHWIVFNTIFVKPGKTLSVAQGQALVDGKVVALANATFRCPPIADPKFTPVD